MEELIEEQGKKAQAQRAFEQERSLNSRMASQQRLQNFLSVGTHDGANMMNFQSTAMGALAAMAYENNISTFSESVMVSQK